MIRSFLILLPATLVPRLATFAVSLVGANLLSVDEFGHFVLVVIIGEMCEMSAVGWIRVVLIRYGANGQNVSRQNLQRVGIVGSLCVVVAMVASGAISWITAQDRFAEMIGSIIIYIFAFSTLRMGLTIIQIQNRKNSYSLIESVRAPAYMGSTMFVMAASDSFFLSSIAGSVIVTVFGLIAIIAGWRYAKLDSSPKISGKKLRQAGIPIVIISLLGFVVSSLDKLMISSLFSKEVVAFYAVAYAFGRQGFDVLANAINIGTFPQLVHIFSEEGDAAAGRHVGQTFSLIVAAALPAAATLLASRELIAAVLLPENYHSAVYTATPIIACGAIFINLKSFVFDNIFHVREKNLLQIPTVAVGALASVGVAFWSTAGDPYISAALIFLTGAAVSLLLSTIISYQMLPVKINWRSVVSSAAISIVTFFLVSFFSTIEAPEWLRVFFVSIVGAGAIAASLVCFRHLRNSRDSTL